MIVEESSKETKSLADGDPFAYTEDLFTRISGEEAGLWIPVSAEETHGKRITEWKLALPDGAGRRYCLYGNLPWTAEVSFDDPQWWDDAQEQGRLTVAEGWSYGYGGWLSPSVFYIPAAENADTAAVTLETAGEMELRDEQFRALDLDRLAQLTAKIRRNAAAVKDLEVRNGRISCTVNAEEGQKLLLSVPASKGWTAVLNGQKTEIGAFEGSLAEISLEPGENHITMQYRTPGLAAGIFLSLTGLGITVYADGKRRKERKTSEDRNNRSNGS